ncbi:MAG: protein kinase [Acidobacteriia bacterium]|nr:protein kinase [Terriglobia bacterium]
MGIPERIGHYRLVRKLGEGGMGVVYAAHDERLDRPVAIKMLRQDGMDEQAAKRLWREARIAAAVNHPNVCQIFEIGEEAGELFIAMELLDGESLAQILERGPLPAADATQMMLGVLVALETMQRREIVHRDLKPSNIFQTAHGIKLLDFGLAAPVRSLNPDLETETALTAAGAVVGTWNYMSPEQLQGQAVDVRSDIFAAGAILFELLAGRRAFAGRTIPEVFHAILYEQPPALAGSAAIAAVDRIIHGALAKKPDDRYQSADSMAQDLRSALLASDTAVRVRARPMTRLIVLPFRILRPDAETDFLAFSLPDAITSSLAGLESLVVRSSMVASRFAAQAADLKAIAAEAEVDIVLTGTLLRAGDQLRVSTQLAEAPSGTLVWSHTSQSPLHDIFQLQDDLVTRIIESVAPSLTAREQRILKHDVPSTAKAYEFFLRANQLGQRPEHFMLARDLYLRCVEEDSQYAPAWARLGRCYRVIGKYGESPEENLRQAEAAFQRALGLNPELALAHNLYTQLEAERGRAVEAMKRLLERARANQNDPELFAGLVHACRYCGLVEACVAAHHQARRLDPNIVTTVGNAHLLMGDYQAALETDASDYMRVLALTFMGREREAIRCVEESNAKDLPAISRLLMTTIRTDLEGRREESIEAANLIIAQFTDPEGLYYMARHLSHLGETAKALATLKRVVDGGFCCVTVFARDPWLDPLRTHAEFVSLLHRAEKHHQEARAVFIEAGGERLLGGRAR